MVDHEADNDRTHTHVVLTKGTMVQHYRIVEKIGAGGMGEVYLAIDNTLNRKVALKFMPAHLASNSEMRSRFIREAQAAAKLDHPNIVPVHEVGEYSGRPFFAMAHIEGKSLRQVIKEGKLTVEQSISFTMQICEGLHKAHEAGVVHRDIKPGNILIDKEDRARIVDFGLATVSGEEKLTKTGSTLGTVGYMSPEQIEGKQVDLRSDLFSVGVILYEMLTGRRPFEGDNDAAVSHSITTSTPEPIARYKSGTTGELQQIVDKALTKEPSLRYQHADGMVADLKRIDVSATAKKRRQLGRWTAVAALIVIIGYFVVDRFVLSKQPTDGWNSSVAVLVFRDLSQEQDQAIFCEGMTEDIINRLTTIKKLKVPGTQSMLRFTAANFDLDEIGRQLDVDHILSGSVRRSGDSIRVSAQLIRLADGASIWAENYDKEGGMSSIFSIQDDISISIAGMLKATLVGSEASFVNRHGTNNMEAYNAYIRGRYFWRKRTQAGMEAAIKCFEDAVALDSNYAAAYAGLSEGWGALAFWGGIDRTTGYSKADTFSLKAIEISPNLAESQASRGLALSLQRKLNEAEEHLLNAIELNPGHPWGHHYYRGVLFMMGRYDEATTQMQIAHSLDPLSPAILHRLGTESHRTGNLDKAAGYFRSILEIEPFHPESYVGLTRVLLDSNDTAEALKIAETMIQQLPDSWKSYKNKGWLLSQLGKIDEAQSAFEKSVEIAPRNWGSHYHFAVFLKQKRHDLPASLAQIELAITLDSLSDGLRNFRKQVLEELGKKKDSSTTVD